MTRRRRRITRENCPYDGTFLINGEPCPECAAEIREHLRTCRTCAEDHQVLTMAGERPNELLRKDDR